MARRVGTAVALVATTLIQALQAGGQDPGDTDEPAAVLKRLNEHRRSAGLPPVGEAPSLSNGCQAHADYLLKNLASHTFELGTATLTDIHTENEKRPGYTTEGAKAAPRSVVQMFNGSPPAESAIDDLIAMLYHRPLLLEPRLTKIGVGIARDKHRGGLLVVDVADVDLAAEPLANPVLYPAAHQEGVPLELALGRRREVPDPRPDASARAGYPITIGPSRRTWKPVEVEARLLAGNEVIECWVSSADKPAREDCGQHVACLLPKQPLRARTRYTVEFKCKQQGIEGTPGWSKTWSFTTGEK